MVNSFATDPTAPALLENTDDPCFKWKIHTSQPYSGGELSRNNSTPFHCSGYRMVPAIDLHKKKPYSITPYAALSLGINPGITSVGPGYRMEAAFVLSIYNHLKQMHCGCEATYHFNVKNIYSEKECLIPLKELLRSPDALSWLMIAVSLTST